MTVTEVQPDPNRLFLVVSGTRSRTGDLWTLVLERQNDYWISRRDLSIALDPAAAVSGFLFDREGYQDPVDVLRRMNEVVRLEYYRLLQEKMKADRTRGAMVEELDRLKTLLKEAERRPRAGPRRARGGRRSTRKSSTPRR